LSKKGGEILNDLYNRVDQANFDRMIIEALEKIPTALQKKFIKEILNNDQWDLQGEPREEEKEKYRRFVDGGSTE
jgi:hypothetical protein